ncbi:MMPL family transporter [Phytohabitans aurantiacus]|jgi:RND superfamily putative drug exporter|uniref:Membrane protein n=1 Tax=Phytohabitans aurantiacus TaxID=3016789 RepID=A0ABQ5QWB4_9ACTN|nr:MMPL family transporter [Phytohabitans aurantiacus]GLH98793.1 membrane protein [Phytohabitans aurantiacus]
MAILTSAATDSRFVRVAGWSYRRRWWALLLWVLVLVGVTAASQAVGSDYHNDFSLPGTDSQRAADTLRQHAPARAGDSVQIVVEATGGVRSVQSRVERMLGEVRPLPHVADVRDPFATEGAVSSDGTIAYATVTLDGRAEEVPADDVRRIIDTAKSAEGDGLRVELGGDAVRGAEESEGGAAEGVGLLAALVILVLLFGSLVAATLPILIAIFGVGSAVGLVVLASHATTVADFTSALMILVGLGVGIDYALLVFSRFRSELRDGADREQAVRTALDTAGRTVFFAGCTVIIALLGLVVLGLGSLQGVAVAVALTVLATMVASLTLLPALLAIVGGRVERRVRRKAGQAEGASWRRWTVAVQRRPWPALLLPVVVLLLIAAPALGMRLGFADAGNDAAGKTSRQAYDLLARGFGPGFNGPLVVVVRGDAGPVQSAISGTPGVAAALPPIPAGDGVSTVIVFPESKPQDKATSDLVHRLRDDVLPRLAQQTGAEYLVGGSTAAAEDFAEAVASRLPLFVLVVVGLSALLLMVVFRSLLVPLKAAALNLLSVAASLGVITYVFQEGAFGVQPGPIEAFVPVMIFAIVFGLSMDYEVFLLSRMHEEWESAGDAARAVREGMATTGRVVTAAGAIMVVVFGSFLLSPDRMLQQFGLGLAVAILLDALVIRCLIVPAVMQLLGTRAWWLPRPIARWLPRVAIERPNRPTIMDQ